MLRTLSGLAGLLLPVTAAAQAPGDPEAEIEERARRVRAITPGMDEPLSIRGELGTALSRGNSETFSISGDVAVFWAFAPWWLSETEAWAIYEESDGEDAANSWSLLQRIDRYVSDRFAIVAGAGLERDPFTDIALRYSGQLGVSWIAWLDVDQDEDPLVLNKLQLELGGYVAREDFEAGPNSVPGDLDEDGRFIYGPRAAVIYNHAFDDRTSAGAVLEAIEDINDAENFVLNASAFAAAAFTKGVAFKLTARNRFDNLPAESGLKKNDFTVNAAIVISL